MHLLAVTNREFFKISRVVVLHRRVDEGLIKGIFEIRSIHQKTKTVCFGGVFLKQDRLTLKGRKAIQVLILGRRNPPSELEGTYTSTNTH